MSNAPQGKHYEQAIERLYAVLCHENDRIVLDLVKTRAAELAAADAAFIERSASSESVSIKLPGPWHSSEGC